MTWTTRSFGHLKEYVVLKHTLKGANYIVNGIKFRDGYAVVEKNSKVYHNLKKIPVLRNAKEYPLTFLTKLSFITRPLDIQIVYGRDVYSKYLLDIKNGVDKALSSFDDFREEQLKLTNELEQAKLEGNEEKIKSLEEEVKETNLCTYINSNTEELCKHELVDYSPDGYCDIHFVYGPKAEEFGALMPKFLSKKEKKTFRENAESVLKRAKKEGKF